MSWSWKVGTGGPDRNFALLGAQCQKSDQGNGCGKKGGGRRMPLRKKGRKFKGGREAGLGFAGAGGRRA